MELIYQKAETLLQRIPRERILRQVDQANYYLAWIKTLGFTPQMAEYEKRKLGVFNQLNFFQLITGVLIPILGLVQHGTIPLGTWLIACLPAFTSLLVLFLNYSRRYQEALLTYFIIYPFLTCVVYLHGLNAGVGLHFILFGILSVFFLQDIGYMIFTVALSMVSYFILQVVLTDFVYELGQENPFLYMLNQALAILFIFWGLYLIKKENAQYQARLLAKNRLLHRKNIKIKKQKELIALKADQLEFQKTELTELNGIKNRLFSVISHDLKTPMYALRNLFQNIQQYDLPANEVKEMVPDVVTDLNYTISLMENLLQWSKSQMNAAQVRPEELDLTSLIDDVTHLMRLQAEAKKVHMLSKLRKPIYVYADREMISLVLRNLLSNAIKFTPSNGTVSIGANHQDSFAEIFISDTGMGISAEALEKINENNFYTTRGTASESGTGLGLMLCKEFLARNGGQMHIESKPGKGSTFSFTLPVLQD